MFSFHGLSLSGPLKQETIPEQVGKKVSCPVVFIYKFGFAHVEFLHHVRVWDYQDTFRISKIHTHQWRITIEGVFDVLGSSTIRVLISTLDTLHYFQEISY